MRNGSWRRPGAPPMLRRSLTPAPSEAAIEGMTRSSSRVFMVDPYIRRRRAIHKSRFAATLRAMRRPSLAIHALFFLSGAGALVLENVWFSQAGLLLGNAVWSAALVTGAFMAGLALGNAAA